MRRSFWLVFLISVSISLSHCTKKKEDSLSTAQTHASADKEKPVRIQVQHILIGFEGSLPGKPVKRSKEEAKKLAEDVLKRAQSGESFEALVKQYSDDQVPGIYGMSDFGVPAEGEEIPRDNMVKGFGDLGFLLGVSEIGLVAFDPAVSPYGFHIVKRLR